MASELLAWRGVRFAYPQGERLASRFPALRACALDDVTISVSAGEPVALLGGNGSGKSTLLKVALGLLVPARGEVWWDGAPLDRSRGGLARMRGQAGLLFQDPDDQLFAPTLLQDAAYGPLNQGLAAEEARERAARALEQVGLGDCADLPPHLLSHGMRKRAALAGVLALRPRLLLLDEPTAGLDPASEEVFLELLADLASRGVAVVLSTHDLDLASRATRRAVVLSRGRVVADAETDAVLSDDALLVAGGLRRAPIGRRP